MRGICSNFPKLIWQFAQFIFKKGFFLQESIANSGWSWSGAGLPLSRERRDPPSARNRRVTPPSKKRRDPPFARERRHTARHTFVPRKISRHSTLVPSYSAKAGYPVRECAFSLKQTITPPTRRYRATGLPPTRERRNNNTGGENKH